MPVSSHVSCQPFQCTFSCKIRCYTCEMCGQPSPHTSARDASRFGKSGTIIPYHLFTHVREMRPLQVPHPDRQYPPSLRAFVPDASDFATSYAEVSVSTHICAKYVLMAKVTRRDVSPSLRTFAQEASGYETFSISSHVCARCVLFRAFPTPNCKPSLHTFMQDASAPCHALNQWSDSRLYARLCKTRLRRANRETSGLFRLYARLCKTRL